MVSFLDAITCVIGRTVHALDVITSISRYNSRSNVLHFLNEKKEVYFSRTILSYAINTSVTRRKPNEIPAFILIDD